MIKNILSTTILFISCAGGPSSLAPKKLEEKPPHPWEAAVFLPEEHQNLFRSSQMEFGIHFHHTLRSMASFSQRNLFYSPLSLSTVLAMVYAGAKGDTGREIKKVLHSQLANEETNQGFRWIYSTLNQKTQDHVFDIHWANGLFVEKTFPLRPLYLDEIRENYGPSIHQVDFIQEPNAQRDHINRWVSQETNGYIKDLLSPGVISASTKLVITNAVYFEAQWRFPFQEKRTRDGEFTNIHGTKSMVPMMNQTRHFGYASKKDFQVLELPYDHQNFSMVIFLPKEGLSYVNVEKHLTADLVQSSLKDIKPQRIDLSMPKFEIHPESFSVKEILKSMGMKLAFDHEADFSGMDEKRYVFIWDIFHQSFIKVSEEKTVAAAATATSFVEKSATLEKSLSLRVDRPFFFMILEKTTQAVLFMGRVVDLPQQKKSTERGGV